MCLLLLVVDNEMPADPISRAHRESAVVAAGPESCHRSRRVWRSVVAIFRLEVVESVRALLRGDLLYLHVAAGRVVVAEAYVVLVGAAHLKNRTDEDFPAALSRVSGLRVGAGGLLRGRT